MISISEKEKEQEEKESKKNKEWVIWILELDKEATERLKEEQPA